MVVLANAQRSASSASVGLECESEDNSTDPVRWLQRHCTSALKPNIPGRRKSGGEAAAAGSGAVFLDLQVQTSPDKKEEDKYSDSCIGRLAGSKVFEWLTIFVIVLNALGIGWDADFSARFGKDENLFRGPLQFAVMECFFCAYFTGEILIRFLAYRIKSRCLVDAWFVFDSVLVALMVVETVVLPFATDGGGMGGLNILRLLRLLRISRMAKLMRAFPQLMMIVKGIAAATKAVVWTGFLLIIVTYTWAIIFTNEYHQGYASDGDTEAWAEMDDLDDPARYGMVFFGTMGKSMLSLLVMGTLLDDVTAACDALRRSGSTFMLAAFLVYILLNSFTMMNMLVGILVEVVGSTAEAERERLVEDGVKESISTIFTQMDKDNSGSISLQEFSRMKTDPQVRKALQELDVKDKQFDMYCDLLFQPDEDGETPTLSFKTLIDAIVRLRPNTSVNALDFASFRQSCLKSQGQLREKVGRIEEILAQLPEGRGGSSLEVGRRSLRSESQKRMEAEELERAPLEDVITEVKRRLSCGSASVVYCAQEGRQCLEAELQSCGRESCQDTESIVGLGVPEWSGEVLVC